MAKGALSARLPSASLRLFKAEPGISGDLPPAAGPSVYSVCFPVIGSASLCAITYESV